MWLRPCQRLHKPHVLVVCAVKQRNKVYLVQLEKSYLLLFSKFDSLEPVWRKSTKGKDSVFTCFCQIAQGEALVFADFLQTGWSKSNFKKPLDSSFPAEQDRLCFVALIRTTTKRCGL
jgi:hypothetical protein